VEDFPIFGIFPKFLSFLLHSGWRFEFEESAEDGFLSWPSLDQRGYKTVPFQDGVNFFCVHSFKFSHPFGRYPEGEPTEGEICGGN